MASANKANVQNEELCSHSSSNRESWGRCSSLGGSEESSSGECAGKSSNRQQRALRALATPLRRIQRKSPAKPKEKKKAGKVTLKKPKREKLEKGDTLGQRLRLCILGHVNLKRHRSA